MNEDNPRDTKRRKTNGVANDHPSRRVLNSTMDGKERSEFGLPEVKVKLLDPYEQYKMEKLGAGGKPPSRHDKEFREEYDHLGRKLDFDDHSFHQEYLQVFVDGLPLHKNGLNSESEFHLSVQLVPRRTGDFHGICDGISADLADVGLTLFTNNGHPRVECLENALVNNDTRKPLLYISFFTLPRHYRSTSSTVGALILKEVLKLFKDEYSVAIYIPSFRAQYDAEEEAEGRRERHNHRPPGVEPTDEEILAEKKRDERYRELTHLDMRQFFRVGFRQVDDAIVLSQNRNSYLFITPQNARESILTEQQALDTPIASPPPPPKPMIGLPKKLFSLMKETCSLYTKSKQEFAAIPMALSLLNDLVKSTSDATKDLLSQCETDEDRLGVILDSHAFHVCAANENLSFIKMLLNLLPEPRTQNTMAMNHLDMDGFTPLMVCARRISGNDMANRRVAQESRIFLESIISLGADKNVLHPQTGLSALGCFREGRERENAIKDIFGFFLGPQQEVHVGGEVSRIETVLEPDAGPTGADDAVLSQRFSNDFGQELEEEDNDDY
uniref:Uncharacterized protein n=1 Tax=Pseudo-nitzschia delicatissima TaxID=44447 RepID=A0A7S0XK39_9STRA|mmetsp:Transcript_1676/g.3914  ORF Transcript_1676/g.3914 Transcript_1676/m.3914 type:complete len:556 (+) Transcript_1676:225-1892(+)